MPLPSLPPGQEPRPGQGRFSAQASRGSEGTARVQGAEDLGTPYPGEPVYTVPWPHTILQVHLSAPLETSGLGPSSLRESPILPHFPTA